MWTLLGPNQNLLFVVVLSIFLDICSFQHDTVLNLISYWTKKVLWIRVCPSVRLSILICGSFLGIGSLVFYETLYDVRSPYGDVHEKIICQAKQAILGLKMERLHNFGPALRTFFEILHNKRSLELHGIYIVFLKKFSFRANGPFWALKMAHPQNFDPLEGFF